MKKTISALCLFILLGINHYSILGASKSNKKAQKILTSICMPTSFEANFVYAHIQGNTKQEDTQEEYQIAGKIWVKGNKYRLVLEDQIVVSNGETIWNYIPSMQEVQIYNEKPTTADKDLTSFSPIQLLQLYKQGFVPTHLQTTIIHPNKQEEITLIPQEKKSDIEQLNLVIDLGNHQIKSMKVLEKDGTVHNFEIINLAAEDKRQDDYFEFQMPTEPIEVVDLR